MNHPIWHIIKKDLVRFRLELAIWCVLLVARVTAGADWSSDPQDSGREAVAVFWVVAVFLFNVHLVVRVLAEDSPLKETAFWRTRPISGGQMLAAKAIFLGSWTLLLPAAVMAAAGFAHGFTVGEVLGVMAGQLVLHGFIGVAFLAITAFFQRVIASVFCFLLLGFFMQLAAGPGPRAATATRATFESASLAATRTGLAAGCLLAGCGIAVWLVYRSRRRTIAALLLVAGIAGVNATTSFWTVDFLGWVPALSRSEPRMDERYQAVVTQTQSSGRSIINGVSHRSVFATMKWSGLAPGEVCVPYRVEGRVVWPDGVELVQNHEERLATTCDLAAALKALGMKSGTRSPFLGEGDGVMLAELLETDYDKLKRAPAEWRGRISVRVGRVEPEARVPLRPGVLIEQGATRITVAELNMDRDQLRVKIQIRQPDLPKWVRERRRNGVLPPWQSASYALINERRSEAAMANGGGGGDSTNDGFLSVSRREVNFVGMQGGREYGPVAWVEWLKEAELVKFRFIEERRVIVDARVPLTYGQ